MPNWLLPENIADVLPSEARKTEELRRAILDRFRAYGYELVMPPLLEYLDSLMPVASPDMNLRMFKLVDQLSGRSLGLRADTTVQVARIDAHLLNRPSVTRLCYAGSVLHTRPSGLHATREPYQIGAEIYGHAGLEADAEIQEMALATLALAGFDKVRLDLCHVGIFGALVAMDPAAQTRRSELYTLLRGKDVAGLREATAGLAPVVREALLALPKLYGDSSVLQQARTILPAESAITRALDDLQALVDLAPAGSVTIDLADLAGYEYESGAMFAIYVPGLPNAVARGGRYDHVGEAFGRARPATGFSLDLRELARLMPTAAPRPAIRAPWGRDAALREMIAALRADGEIVIQSMPGHENDQDEFECDRVIVPEAGNWTIKKLEQ